MNCKVSRRKNIIRIRVEINDRDLEETEKSNRSFLRKTKLTSSQLTKKMKEIAKINKIKNEVGNIKTGTT